MASQSDIVSQQVEGAETRAAGKAKKGGSRGGSRDMLSSMETRLAKVELAMANVVDRVEDTEGRIELLDSRRDELKDELLGDVQGALNESLDGLTQRNHALEAIIEALRIEVEELKGELSTCKTAMGGGMFAGMPRHRVEIPRPKEFRGTREAKDVDNFLWGMEQYFYATGIEDDATKVNTASMYLTDLALLWWRRRCEDTRRGLAAIGTWESFQREFRQQFYPEYALDEARGKLRRLTQQGKTRDYCREFSELMLMIPDMSDREALFSFMDGLKPWVKTELQRRGVQDLSRAIAVAESLIEYERTESPKRRDKQPSGGDKDRCSSSEDEADEKPRQRKFKTERVTRDKGQDGRKPLSCFLCDGPHRVRDCPERKTLTAIVRAIEESESESDRHQEKPQRVSRLSAIRMGRKEESPPTIEKDQHYEEPQRVLRLSAIRMCREMEKPPAQVGKNATETMGCNTKSDNDTSNARSDLSFTSARKSTRRRRGRKHRPRTRDKDQGGTSSIEPNIKPTRGDLKSTGKAMGPDRGTTGPQRSKRNQQTLERARRSNEGVARMSGGDCHGPRARPCPLVRSDLECSSTSEGSTGTDGHKGSPRKHANKGRSPSLDLEKEPLVVSYLKDGFKVSRVTPELASLVEGSRTPQAATATSTTSVSGRAPVTCDSAGNASQFGPHQQGLESVMPSSLDHTSGTGNDHQPGSHS